MKRFAISAVLATAVMFGTMSVQTTPAEARNGRLVAGIAIGAIVGGIIASEAYRYRRARPHYYSYSYGYAPRPYYYGYAPRYRYYRW